MNFGALSRGFGTCCLRFKNDVATIPARLTSGWLARLCREGVDPLDRCKRFQVIHPPFLDLAWRKGSFILKLPHITRSPRRRVGGSFGRLQSFNRGVALPAPPVLPTERIAHLRYGRRPLHRGISPGHSGRIDATPACS